MSSRQIYLVNKFKNCLPNDLPDGSQEFGGYNLKPTFYEKYMPTANTTGRINLASVDNLGTRCKLRQCPRQPGLLA
jgi:hypothetical protein